MGGLDVVFELLILVRQRAPQLPTERQEPVVFQVFLPPDEACRELAFRVFDQLLLDLHLILARDDLMVRLVLLGPVGSAFEELRGQDRPRLIDERAD